MQSRNGRGPGALLLSWALTHIDLALRICWVTAGVFAVASAILLYRVTNSWGAGALVFLVLLRAALLIPEQLAAARFQQDLTSGHFDDALRGPGLPRGRRIQILTRMVTDRSDRASSEQAARFVSFWFDTGEGELSPIMRVFEHTWGRPPQPAADQNLVRSLLERRFRFTTSLAPRIEASIGQEDAISWRDLWRHRLFDRLRELHPGERLSKLLFRLYASEWQRSLAPAWVLGATITLVALYQPWVGVRTRGLLFWSAGSFFAVTAWWLAFFLRPGAFNTSLLVGDMSRCARWVLESMEGKHFLVAALGSKNPRLRGRAIQLLLWNDILLQSGITLPEGMRAFARREGTRRSRPCRRTGIRLEGIGAPATRRED